MTQKNAEVSVITTNINPNNNVLAELNKLKAECIKADEYKKQRQYKIDNDLIKPFSNTITNDAKPKRDPHCMKCNRYHPGGTKSCKEVVHCTHCGANHVLKCCPVMRSEKQKSKIVNLDIEIPKVNNNSKRSANFTIKNDEFNNTFDNEINDYEDNLQQLNQVADTYQTGLQTSINLAQNETNKIVSDNNSHQIIQNSKKMKRQLTRVGRTKRYRTQIKKRVASRNSISSRRVYA